MIGEAAKKLPPDLRSAIEADWKRIASLRDVLIHEYFGVDVEIIWDVVRNKIPSLYARVSSYLSSN